MRRGKFARQWKSSSAALLVTVALGCSRSAPPPPAPATPAAAPSDSGSLHNLHSINADLISGAQPDGDAAFDELTQRGIRTIISVDGTPPDVERAKARGIRYVHIPVGYDGISPTQRLQLAKAVGELPSPIYLHCHHGKHRGPTAAALAAISLGKMSAADGTAFLKAAGTAPNYSGLYACIASAGPLPADALRSPDIALPERASVSGLAATMIIVDEAADHLSAIQKAGWKTPADHPDLVPAAEAGRLADALRDLLVQHESGKLVATHAERLQQAPPGRGSDFGELMKSARGAAQALEAALVANEAQGNLDAKFKPVLQSCQDCHRSYRD